MSYSLLVHDSGFQYVHVIQMFGGGMVRAVLVFGSGSSSAKRVLLCFSTV